MYDVKNPTNWRTHGQLAAESIERQRQAKMLRDWVNKQQNPHVGLRRKQSIVARIWAGWDVDMRVGMFGVACLFALGVIVKTWG
jgi:hypothetical protein